MIGVIAPYSKFKGEVEITAKRLNIPIVAEVGALNSGLRKAKNMIKTHKVKVIIARASTADYLREKLDIPIIKIEITNFDVIKTLKSTDITESFVVLLNHFTDQNRIDIQTISEIMNIQLDVKYFGNERDITRHLNTLASQNDLQSIVGTAECVAATAGRKGMQSLVVYTQEESITEALLRSKEAMENLLKEEIKQRHLETIISHAFDGVISTNQDGYITVCNDVAANYIGIFENEIIQRYYKSIHIPLLKKLFGDGQNITKHIINNGNQKFVLNRNHLGEESYVITFQEVETLVESDSNIRSKLYNRGFFAKYHFEDIIHKSKEMKQTVSLAKAYSKSEGNILIYGESGTGKELFAQSIHNESFRSKGPFVAINCAALPENLLESELFGYDEGAFTGAKKGGKPGLFEMAHKGTIFLDEIGEVSLSLQARLLRVLQEKEVMRIGGEKIIPVDVRVIAATNKNLKDSVEKQKFREDLYYRLNILYIHIPPLRKRIEDIELLIDALFAKYGGQPEFITDKMKEDFKRYNWPGNIRELENFIERIITIKQHLHEDVPLTVIKHAFQPNLAEEAAMDDYIRVKVGSLQEMETEIYEQLLNKFDGNKTLVANKLGISRTTLWKKVKEVT
ncbi:MAG TPA: sigma-54-dependent Fis family transcriptional regulator [Bacillus bacterium]|uniref:Sigma-54-dependent Fis family transcriptional regulator n=1 Tax=Siminovitchia fordii TaxID=254759 RepID=A0ABQ4KAY7_9BACI|nr:sigma 54-interacting transcriptional regulator [Siminovitchia fordii]GIN22278.1 sigma-54-dependent Fis family transcriptional regulator [Siminovitchia fordii]HBZ10756.1 sigma-54-dependent Fis family transcriptional regulator [Bacillus sp. (in: firmicutes)]